MKPLLDLLEAAAVGKQTTTSTAPLSSPPDNNPQSIVTPAEMMSVEDSKTPLMGALEQRNYKLALRSPPTSPNPHPVFTLQPNNESKLKMGSGTLTLTDPSEALFHQALEKDRTFVADSRVKSSTLEANAQMLLAIQKGDVAALKKILEHGVARSRSPHV